MILSTRMSIRIADLYFGETAPAQLKADIIRYNQSPVRIDGARCTPFSTIVVNLSESEDQVYGKFKSHTRWKIRRTQKDQLSYEFSDGRDEAILKQFTDHLDRCADLKQLPRASKTRMNILSMDGAFDISFVRDGDGEILAASSYFVTPFRVRGLWAGAVYRSTNDPTRRTLIGRANRLLYWRDMLRFKQAGVQIFDFGGYYVGSEDSEKLRVNEFKLEFGGEVLHEFNCQLGLSWRGRAALWAQRRQGEWALARRSRLVQRKHKQHDSSVPASV